MPGPANRALEMFRRKHCIAGQVLQCVDGAFCEPPPDWVVQGHTLGCPMAVARNTSSNGLRPFGPLARWNWGWRTWENLADYVQENPYSWYTAHATSNRGKRAAFSPNCRLSAEIGPLRSRR